MRPPARSAAEPWLAVVGIGDAGLDSLSAEARGLVDTAEVVVGGARHLAMLGDHGGERLEWRRPIEATLDLLAERRGRRVVVLASGDPMHFGVGELLCRTFPIEEMHVLPAPSAFSLVCARLGWPLTSIEPLSLHGRRAEVLNRHLQPGARLVVLSNDGATPAQIAELLAAQGFGPSRIWVFEHLGSAAEDCHEGTAAAWTARPSADLNTVAIECRPDADVSVLPTVPGLPDDAFRSDGMLTKREVRAATLARLVPLPGQYLWDVGAGSGAVGIEWLRATRRARAVAIERNAARCTRIRDNAARLGTPELEVVEAEAPACLGDLPTPDAVFVGGGIGHPELLERCFEALGPGGRLVANTVTVEGERRLADWHARHGGELVRLAISRAEPLGPHHGWRALMPVTQLALQKP